MKIEPAELPSPSKSPADPNSRFRNQLLEPEPLTEIPSDFVGGYYCVPFPTGSYL